MKKENRKAYVSILKEVVSLAPSVVFSAVLDGAIIGLRPFIAIYLTGILIDAAYQGKKAEELAVYAVYGVGSVLILSLIESFTVKHLNRNMEYMYERQIGPLSKKSMQMDYDYLEDPKIRKMREYITDFYPRFGLIGIVVDSILHFTDVLVTIIAAIIIVVPKLIAGSRVRSGFVGSMLFSLLFFLFILVINYLNVKILNHFNGRYEKIADEKGAPLDTRRKFFLNLFSKADTQKDVRMCGQEDLIRTEVNHITDDLEGVRKEAMSNVIQRCLASDSISTISTVLVYLFVGLYGYFGVISIGNVVSFAASIRRVTDSIFYLGLILGDIRLESGCAVHYMNFMNLAQRKHEGTIPMEKRRDGKFSVEFDHVSFRYPGSETYVIKDLNLSFVIGEKMAIVGKNGSGKTTFIKLLCRLYDVTEGCIKVNGIDIRKFDYREYCDLFSVVFQDFTIFDFGVGENIANSTEWDEEKAYDALERAGLAERAQNLAEGLSTVIGKGFDEDGVNFSGGEKQKLAIARAIYKDAPFVIMDEPTAALDPEAECEVFAGFDKMVGNKTAIYISHRLASCRFCEDILVFDKGKIVQRGKHEVLEKEPGLYQQLWNAQAQYYA